MTHFCDQRDVSLSVSASSWSTDNSFHAGNLTVSHILIYSNVYIIWWHLRKVFWLPSAASTVDHWFNWSIYIYTKSKLGLLENARRRSCAGSMLGQRLQRWRNIEPQDLRPLSGASFLYETKWDIGETRSINYLMYCPWRSQETFPYLLLLEWEPHKY